MNLITAQQDTFILDNHSIAYVINKASNGVLLHTYFGKSLSNINKKNLLDLGFLWSKTYLDKNNKENEFEDELYLDTSPFELASDGLSDTRLSPIQIEANNSLLKLEFYFESYRIYEGLPALKGQPHIKQNNSYVETIEFTLSSENIKVLLSFSIFKDKDIILRNTKIINKNDYSIWLNRALSLSIDFTRNDFDLIHFPGDWSFERQYRREKLSEGNKRFSSLLGRSGHEYNPFIYLANYNVDNDNGDIYGFSIVYSGNFLIDVGVNKYSSTRVSMGINDELFKFEINKNEEFVLPEAVMSFSSSGLNGISQNFHSLINENLINKNNLATKESILLNSWEGCYFDFDTEKVKKFISKSAKLGAELFVLDDGWFGKRDSDTCSLGDWNINPKIDLKEVIDECHKNNMKFGIWIEPEMVNPNSELFKEDNTVASGKALNYRSLSRHQLPLDMLNKKAVDKVYNSISKILSTYDIDYVKWDNNRVINDSYSTYLDEKHQQEFYHRTTLAIYELCEKFISNFPNIFFQGCASGGGRFDLGMLYYFPEIWTSDENDPIQRLLIQYSTSYLYPLSVMGSHVNKNPITSYENKAKIALFGSYGFELDPSTLKEDEVKQIENINSIFKCFHKEVITNGTLYHLDNPFLSNYMSMISVSTNKEKALALFANFRKETLKYRYFKLKGLDPNKIYKNSYNDQILSGEELCNVGLNLSRWLDEFSILLISFTEVNE